MMVVNRERVGKREREKGRKGKGKGKRKGEGKGQHGKESGRPRLCRKRVGCSEHALDAAQDYEDKLHQEVQGIHLGPVPVAREVRVRVTRDAWRVTCDVRNRK